MNTVGYVIFLVTMSLLATAAPDHSQWESEFSPESPPKICTSRNGHVRFEGNQLWSVNRSCKYKFYEGVQIASCFGSQWWFMLGDETTEHQVNTLVKLFNSSITVSGPIIDVVVSFEGVVNVTTPKDFSIPSTVSTAYNAYAQAYMNEQSIRDKLLSNPNSQSLANQLASAEQYTQAEKAAWLDLDAKADYQYAKLAKPDYVDDAFRLTYIAASSLQDISEALYYLAGNAAIGKSTWAMNSVSYVVQSARIYSRCLQGMGACPSALQHMSPSSMENYYQQGLTDLSKLTHKICSSPSTTCYLDTAFPRTPTDSFTQELNSIVRSTITAPWRLFDSAAVMKGLPWEMCSSTPSTMMAAWTVQRMFAGECIVGNDLIAEFSAGCMAYPNGSSSVSEGCRACNITFTYKQMTVEEISHSPLLLLGLGLLIIFVVVWACVAFGRCVYCNQHQEQLDLDDLLDDEPMTIIPPP